MKIVTWSIVNNEISFIEDIIKHHLPWIDGMYILDTGSTDGTIDVCKEYTNKFPNKIVFEQYPIKYTTQYDLEWHEMSDPFPEVVVRNYAINNATYHFKPDWLIQLDGDEIFLPSTRDVINDNYYAKCIGHSTINPVCNLSEHPFEGRNGLNLYDPHVRIWRPDPQIKYISNPAFGGKQYHCIPTYFGQHLFLHKKVAFTNDPIHFHLHWMYGKKVEMFYNRKNVFDRKQMIALSCDNDFAEFMPQYFWDKTADWIDSKF